MADGQADRHKLDLSIPLHDHIVAVLVEMDKRYEQRFIAQEKAVLAALANANAAVTKSEETANARMSSMNEFREALSDQATRLMTRLEADQRFAPINERLTKLENEQAELAGIALHAQGSRGQNNWLIGLVVTNLIAVVAIVANLLFRH